MRAMMQLTPIILLVCLTFGTALAYRDEDEIEVQPSLMEMVKFIQTAAGAQLASAVFYERIETHAEEEVWETIDNCLKTMQYNEQLLKKLMEWDNLAEFVELQMTKASAKSDNFFYTGTKGKGGGRINGNSRLDLLLRLTPVKYWDKLQGINFPIARDKYEQKEAVAEILLQACNDGKNKDDKMTDLPEFVKSSLGQKEIQDVFLALITKTYVEGAFTDADKLDISSRTKSSIQEKKWKKIAGKIMKGDALLSACVDSSLDANGARDVDQDLQRIATDLGVPNCVPFAAYELQTMMFSSFTLHPPVFNRVSLMSPPSSGGGNANVGAPTSNRGTPNLAPRRK